MNQKRSPDDLGSSEIPADSPEGREIHALAVTLTRVLDRSSRIPTHDLTALMLVLITQCKSYGLELDYIVDLLRGNWNAVTPGPDPGDVKRMEEVSS